MKALVISLRRTPGRWAEFQKHNSNSLKGCKLIRIDGVDGIEQLATIGSTRIISKPAREGWTLGALGTALSHMLCWRRCSLGTEPVVIMEDDVILANNWQQELQQLILANQQLVLLGWNLDSMLHAELFENQEFISLFEPAYPNIGRLKKIVNSKEPRKLKRLRSAFGLPAYWLTPKMAENLLKSIGRLEVVPIELKRGFPTCLSSGIDGLLNNHYWNLEAQVVIPPLALALNNRDESLTRKKVLNFGE